MKDNAIIKIFMTTIPKHFPSDQCADSQVNQMKLFENFGTTLLKSSSAKNVFIDVS